MGKKFAQLGLMAIMFLVSGAIGTAILIGFLALLIGPNGVTAGLVLGGLYYAVGFVGGLIRGVVIISKGGDV